ncbi:SDR family oxidoreductase [Gluconacetobacter azotocaptans]|uniref:D-erythronate dehydrogenase n=1 Tax=Gluconacetobacter azotocaptans TaxID=142834 RepID=UPI001959D929|nr:D-erythronate dehydrogenase [Gluconacetobacter azotocaptans]MBM9403772.1 SDR family oxidoreductase [Gluconacetobacter azotocaptans]
MHVLILGAAGMIGRKLAEALGRAPVVGSHGITRLTLADVVLPAAPPGLEDRTDCLVADLGQPGEAARMAALRPDLVFHLAAIVSGDAEANLEKGYRINLDGTRALFDALRPNAADGARPRVIFASTNAVFGGDMPDVIGDDYLLTPQTSYGTQKAMCELLLADYTRRGLLDGIGLRLPTICVRPGKPNLAASGFFSNIIREPLVGQEAILPVGEDVRHWMTSPRSAVSFFLHAATLDPATLGGRPNLTMPGLSVTVGEQIEALRKIAGPRAVALIRREPDPLIQRIVTGWARAFDPARARALGFVAEAAFEDIIQAHIDDELGGEQPGLRRAS